MSPVTTDIHVAHGSRYYFDVVSKTEDSYISVMLYDTGPDTFLFSYVEGPFTALINGSFSNGTAFHVLVPATGGISVSASDADGIHANWMGSGFSFTGSSLTNGRPVEYELKVDAPEYGVQGTVKFKAVSKLAFMPRLCANESQTALPHYPCSSVLGAGASEMLLPHIFWANAVPDAHAVVDLVINGSHLSILDGIGYHDKNWGDRPIGYAVSSWTWGHARLGPYSLVWYDALDWKGTEYVSGYVAKHGKILMNSCEPQAVSARPWGANNTYPPVVGTGSPQGLELVFGLGDERLIANVTSGPTVVNTAGTYMRILGAVVGGIGRECYKGKVLLEELKFNS